MRDNVVEAISRFREAAIAKGNYAVPAARDHHLLESMASAWRALYASGDAGRSAFKALLEDESQDVRGWVAAQLLSEGDQSAVPILEDLATDKGLLGFNAEMTLKEWRKGRLGSPFGTADA